MDIFTIFTEKALHNEPIDAPSWAQNCLHIDWLKSPCWNMKWYVIKIFIILFFVLLLNTIHCSFIVGVGHTYSLFTRVHSFSLKIDENYRYKIRSWSLKIEPMCMGTFILATISLLVTHVGEMKLISDKIERLVTSRLWQNWPFISQTEFQFFWLETKSS